MKNLDRRKFIKSSMLGAMIPTFFEKQNLWGLGHLEEKILTNDNVLVVIQLSGGNDGLNTIVPINQYDKYLAARSNIALVESKLLKVPQAAGIGLNPALSPFAQMLQEGKGAIVQDVGYPNPNFSHFRATDIWNTGSSATEIIESGWMGRYLGSQHPSFPENYPNTQYPDPLSIQIGSVMSTALQGPLFGMGMSISSTSEFLKLLSNENEPLPNTLAGKELGYLRQVAKQTNLYAETIKKAALKVSSQKPYPNESLANQLKTVARLIAGGLKTKVYYVKLGGFDTHSNQTATDTTTGTHANLLKSLSEAIKAFQDDLKFLGVADKVLGMTYSEFGRRIKSNASAGTDHGAAAPMLFFGEKVNSTYFGQPTSIASVTKNEDNVAMQHDFRSIYSSILKYWFCVDDTTLKAITLGEFQPLPIVSPGICGYITATEPQLDGKLVVFPNPATDFVQLRFVSKGGECNIGIFDMRGTKILTPIEEVHHAEGSHELLVDVRNLPKGLYLVRFENQRKIDVRKLMK
jgi:uncharacterized protein (DUF1501 family)